MSDRKRPPLPGDGARRIEKWREVAAAAPLDVSKRGDLARHVITKLPVPAIAVSDHAPLECWGPLARRCSLPATSSVILRLAQVEVPGFERIDAASIEQLVHVVQVAALQTLGDAAHLLGGHLVECVAVNRGAFRKIGPSWLQVDPGVRLDQFGVGDIEFDLARLGTERPDVVHPGRAALFLDNLQHGQLQPLAAGDCGGGDEGGSFGAGEAVDGGEVEIGGVAVVGEVAKAKQRAPFEHEPRVTSDSNIRADVSKDIIALDGLGGQSLIVGALGDEAFGNHAATTASSSDAAYGQATPHFLSTQPSTPRALRSNSISERHNGGSSPRPTESDSVVAMDPIRR